MALPVVALVGRPNVGKSTLFNRISHTRKALVADFPGLTRDRQYHETIFQDRKFIVVDTGGMGVADIAVDELMLQQSQRALEEADVVLFLVDGRAGLMPLDTEIAQMLRKTHKPIILVINKVDGLNEVNYLAAHADFQALGLPVTESISASHGRGVHVLLETLMTYFPPQELEVNVDQREGVVRIACIGRPNVGKSTLINRMLGEDRVVVYDLPGTTRDSIEIPFEREGQAYQLIDTAGVRRRSRVDEKIEKFSIIKTIQAIESADVCLLLLDAQEGVTEQDLTLLAMIIDQGRALVVLVNKWDGLTLEHKQNVRKELERRLTFAPFAKLRFISALHGTGVGILYKDILQAYASATKPFATPLLTRLLQKIVEQHAPPLHKGRTVKMRYAHAGGRRPPVIVIHGNQLDSLPDSYKRYLNHAFMQHLKLVGTPLKLEFKTSTNPWVIKKK